MQLLAWVYIWAVAGMSLYGFLGLLTLWLYWRHRADRQVLPVVPLAELPAVTVQLPVYNERYVIGRLIETAVSLQYPPGRLQIQVLDDSTDDTTRQAETLVHTYAQQGINISLIHRHNRTGYKAGALAHALPAATGDFIAIFDADFQPPPDFLQRTIPYFATQPQLGMVQARWDHLNAHTSALTAAQAIALDKHFAMDQTVRHRANLFPKFNGAAGVWRRQCIEDVGGWRDDTVCEDLCLSTRAILRQWQFLFLPDVTAPAELPNSILAYKSQQARWAKGSMQCVRKYGRAILTDSHHSWLARGYALLSMSAYVTHYLLIVLLLLLPILLAGDYHFSPRLLFLTGAGLGQPLLFITSQQVLYPDWWRRLRHLPAMLVIAIGLAPSNVRAMTEVFFGRAHPFIRTPKMGTQATTPSPSYRLPFDAIILVEMLLALYALLGIVVAMVQHNLGPVFFLLTCFLGYTYVSILSWRELR